MNDSQFLSARDQQRRAELDQFAAEERATPATDRPQHLAPIGPPPGPPGPGAVSRGVTATAGAIHQGLGRGGEAALHGVKEIGGGLLQAVSPVRQASDVLGEWTARMRGVKRAVDGAFAVLFSPATAATGAISEGFDPATLDTPVLNPYLSGFIRSFMGGHDPVDSRKTNVPMTGREVLDLLGGALFLGAMHKAGAPGEAKPGGAGGGGGAPEAGPARPLALPGGAEPRALPTREPRALGPAPKGVTMEGGPSNVLEMSPGERWTVIEALDKEGKLGPLQQAIEASASTLTAGEVSRETTPRRSGTGEPTPTIQSKPADVSMTQVVDQFGKPVEAGAPSMTEREYLRARERTPLSAEAQGRIGPHADLTDADIVEMLKAGEKPAALLPNQYAERGDFEKTLAAVKTSGLPYEVRGQKIAVGKDQAALGHLLEAWSGESESPMAGDLPGHAKLGRALGYSTADIRAYERENAARLAGESAAKDVLAQEPELASEFSRLLGDESGVVSLDTVSMLGRMAVGALLGSSDGDTVEERVKNGLMGMGVGALLSRRVAGAVIKAVSSPRVLNTLRDESGVIRIPNVRVIETTEKVKQFMRDMVQDDTIQKELEQQARGIRSRETTTKAGLALIRSGKFRAQKVLDAEPGTIWNAEEAAAARMLTVASANRAVKIAGEVEAGRARLVDLEGAIALSARMTTNTHAVMTEQGRALNALGMTVSGDVPMKITPERLAEEAAKAPRDERLPRIILDLADEHGPEAVGRFARWRQALPDALLEVYYGVSLLSNPLTQARNIVGNSMAVAAALGERQLSGVLASVNPFKDPNKPHVALGEAGQMAIAGVQSIGDAIRVAAKTAREGTNVTKLDLPMREPAFTAERLGVDPSTPWGAGLDYLGKYARFNLKMLEGVDTLYKIVNFNMERTALALRQAEFEGLQGEAKSTRAAELTLEPPDWLLQQAWGFAKEQTFSRDFEGRMRSLQNGLSHPILKVTVLPFFRVPLRLAEYSAERTPVLNLVTSQFWQDMKTGGARAEIALGKLGTGAAIAAAVGWATLQGFITGNPPKDAQERKRMEEDGVKWTSVYNPTTRQYYNYGNLEPISSIVAVVADAVNMLKRAPDTEDLPTELSQVATAVTVSAVRNLASKQYLQSVGHFLDAVQNPDTNGALKLLQKQLASWVPAIAGQAARMYDPVIRETETLLDEVQKKLPFLSQDLVPRRNLITGEPMTSATFYSDRSGDPVLNEIARLQGAGIRAPAPALAGTQPSRAPIPMDAGRAGQGIPLNTRQYDRLLQFMTTEKAGGLTLHERLGQEVASETYKRQSDGVDGGKALALRGVVHAYAQLGRARLEEEMGPAIRDHIQKRIQRLLPADAVSGSLGR